MLEVVSSESENIREARSLAKKEDVVRLSFPTNWELDTTYSEKLDFKGKQQSHEQNANHIIPVKQFKTPACSSKFLSVCPRAPAQHRYDAKNLSYYTKRNRS